LNFNQFSIALSVLSRSAERVFAWPRTAVQGGERASTTAEGTDDESVARANSESPNIMSLAAASSPTETSPDGSAAHAFGNESRAGAIPTQLISFAIGDDQYGVDIMAVREIKGWSEITHLPNQPDYVRGVLNLRGVIVPIVDLRCRFGQGLTQATPLHIVIIVQIAAKPIGLLADRVLDIVSLEESQVKPVPRIAHAQRANFLSGLVTIEGAMIALIDLQNLLSMTAEPSGDGNGSAH
jgi:purine-binding chemotaxis protein CheW